MIDKVKQIISEHSLMRPHDRILVALSGGPDSVVLLHVLCKLRSGMKIDIGAIHINHQIRIWAAAKEERFCHKLCDSLGVDLLVVKEDIPALAQLEKKGIEETARIFRYGVFERIAEEDGFERIAVGHNADDQAETVLFRVLRGTGRTGLIGIPIKRGKIIRPLLQVTREEILAYLKKHRLAYCVDKSNQDTTYKRNYIRNRLLIDVRKHLNPAVDTVLRNLADTMMEEEQYLDSIVYQTYKKVVKMTVGGKLELDLNKYNKYAKWLRRRLLRYCLTEGLGIVLMPDRTTVERLDHVCQRRLKAVSLPESVRAVTVGEKIVLMKGKISGYTVELERSRKVEIPGLNLQMKYQICDYNPGLLPKARRTNRAVLAWDSIQFPLLVRNIRTGDRFQPLGMKGHKKIGDYLTDRKVSPVYRDEILVVCDRDGIVWLAGYEIADRVKVVKPTGKVVKVECVKQRQGAAKTI